MTLEHFSYTAVRLEQDVLDKVGDGAKVQITDPMVIRWINDGAREIQVDHTWLTSSANIDILAGTSIYDVSALTRIKLINQVLVNGVPLLIVTQTQLFQDLANSGVNGSTGTPVEGSIAGSNLQLWPTPNATKANGLTVYFSQYAADIAAIGDQLTVPDRYYNALLNYVLAQAQVLLNQVDSAAASLNTSAAAARAQHGKEQMPSNYYPTITYDDDGYGYGSGYAN